MNAYRLNERPGFSSFFIYIFYRVRAGRRAEPIQRDTEEERAVEFL